MQNFCGSCSRVAGPTLPGALDQKGDQQNKGNPRKATRKPPPVYTCQDSFSNTEMYFHLSPSSHLQENERSRQYIQSLESPSTATTRNRPPAWVTVFSPHGFLMEGRGCEGRCLFRTKVICKLLPWHVIGPITSNRLTY